MRNKGTLFYSVSQAKVLNEIYWQKGPVTFKLCKSSENSTGHRPGGQHYCRTLPLPLCLLEYDLAMFNGRRAIEYVLCIVVP